MPPCAQAHSREGGFLAVVKPQNGLFFCAYLQILAVGGKLKKVDLRRTSYDSRWDPPKSCLLEKVPTPYCTPSMIQLSGN